MTALGASGWLNGDAILLRAMIANFTKLVPAGEADRFCPGEYPDGGETDSLLSECYGNRHAGKWIVSFTDGHVESLLPQKLFDRWNPSIIARWNIDGEPH